MNKDDEIIEAFKRAIWVDSKLVNKKHPLKRICRSRKLRPSLLDWLIMQLGISELEKERETSSGNCWQNILQPGEAGSNELYPQSEIFESIKNLSRKRGRPRIEKPAPQANGRPKKYPREYMEDWLIVLDNTNNLKRYKDWLRDNSKRNSEASRILFNLECILTKQNQLDVKAKARARLKYFQNMISKTRQLSRKPPE